MIKIYLLSACIAFASIGKSQKYVDTWKSDTLKASVKFYKAMKTGNSASPFSVWEASEIYSKLIKKYYDDLVKAMLPEYRKAFIEEQALWQKYVDKQSEAFGAMVGVNGTGWKLWVNANEYYMKKDRANILHNLIDFGMQTK